METVIILLLLLLSVIFTIILSLRFLFKSEISAIRMARKHSGNKIDCLRCSDCCSKTVIVSDKEIKSIQDETHMSEDDFIVSKFKIKMLRRNKNGMCIFHEITKNNSGDEISSCKIYKVRPGACQRFPRLKYFRFDGLDMRCHSVQKMNKDLKNGK